MRNFENTDPDLQHSAMNLQHAYDLHFNERKEGTRFIFQYIKVSSIIICSLITIMVALHQLKKQTKKKKKKEEEEEERSTYVKRHALMIAIIDPSLRCNIS